MRCSICKDREARSLRRSHAFSVFSIRPVIIDPVLDLNTEVKFVKGVGPRIAEWLGQKDIAKDEGLVYYLPFRYEERLNPRGIGELLAGGHANVIAEDGNPAVFRTCNGQPIFEVRNRA